MVNALFYSIREEATFSVKLVMAKSNSFVAGVVSLRNNSAIIKSTGFDAAAWITGLSADVVNLENEKFVYFVAFAPSDATAPTKMSEFWSVPTRRFGSTGPENGVVTITPPLTSALSFKVKGAAEDKTQAVLVVGIQATKVREANTEFHLGFRAPLGAGQAGFVQGVDAVAAT
jgi:hypothetical protein